MKVLRVIERKSSFPVGLMHNNGMQLVFNMVFMVLNSLKPASGCVRHESFSCLLAGKKGALQHLALCSVSRCDKMVAASKRFTIHRVPKVLTVCLNRVEHFTGAKISKVCTQVECKFLFLEQELSQRSMLFHKPFVLGFSCSLLGRREFLWQDKHVLCSARAALAKDSFRPPNP